MWVRKCVQQKTGDPKIEKVAHKLLKTWCPLVDFELLTPRV